MSDILDTGYDQPLIFSIAARNARGRIVRLGPVLDTILSAHSYPPAAERLLAESLVLTALLGSTLKDAAGQLTLQAQTEGGPIELLVCDYRGGELRGYLKFDGERLAAMPAQPSLFALFGKGYLALTFDQVTTGERYQGIVPLEGASIGEAAEHYFVQSEQLPSLIRLATRHVRGADKSDACVAGGLLVQHLAEGEEGRERLHVRLDHPEWEHVLALAQTISDAELTDPELPVETIAWRLFNEEEVRVLAGTPLVRGCRCDAAHLQSVIGRFPESERIDMADTAGNIAVDCAFCSKIFTLPLALFDTPQAPADS